jgi:agmatinase
MIEKKHFDPNDAAKADSGIFGLNASYDDAALVLIPVPWEATTSYGGGTSLGPQAILQASKQVDLFDLNLGRFYEQGLFMLPESSEIVTWNKKAKAAAQLIIQNHGEAFSDDAVKDKSLKDALQTVNQLSEKLNLNVYEQTKKVMADGKIPALVGGDHSAPFGTIKACLEKYPGMGILHVDAHADLRQAYEGFKYSHASIMYNVVHELDVKSLTQVGIRDFSESEFQEIENSKGRINTFFDEALNERKACGESLALIIDEILKPLPREIYISFDIDGLDPILCPHTGTPVPGGLSFQDALFLIKRVVKSGRHIVGFDLNEVSPANDGSEWDANVGARLLYKLCGWTLHSVKNKQEKS